jgi:Co/Zn/Cd efflux system component
MGKLRGHNALFDGWFSFPSKWSFPLLARGDCQIKSKLSHIKGISMPGEKSISPTDAAKFSVAAAVLLTVLKLGVGLATNSLGVLSKAAHSALDLMAAGMTFFAVRVAAVSTDKDHPYGPREN